MESIQYRCIQITIDRHIGSPPSEKERDCFRRSESALIFPSERAPLLDGDPVFATDAKNWL